MYHLGEEIDETIEQASDLLWNSKLEQSGEMLKSMIDTHAWALVRYVEGLMLNTMFRDRGYEELIGYISKLETMCNETLSRYNKGMVGYVSSIFTKAKPDPVLATLSNSKKLRVEVECYALLAECYANYSFTYFRMDSFVKAGYYGRKAWKQYEALGRKVEEYVKAFGEEGKVDIREAVGIATMGLGLFHFAISLTPPSMLWIVELIGFKADRQNGLREIRETMVSDSHRGLHASIVMVGVNRFFYLEKEENLRLIENIYARYPESAPVMALVAFLERYDYRVDDAIATYEKCIACAQAELPGLAIAAKYELSCCYWFLGDFERAIELMEGYLETGTSQFRAHLAWKLGFCYWMVGRKDDIKPLYHKLDGWIKPNMSFDKFASRRARLFLERECFDAFEEVFIPAFNLYQAGRFEASLAALEKVPEVLTQDYVPNIPKQDCVALYRYGKACNYQYLGDRAAATKNFNKVISLDPNIEVENWIVPLSYLALAEMERDGGNFEAGLGYVKQAKGYRRKYDLDKPISVQCMMIQEHCKGKKKLPPRGPPAQ